MREEFRVNVLERVLVHHSLGTLLEEEEEKIVKNDRTRFRERFIGAGLSDTLYIIRHRPFSRMQPTHILCAV